MNDSPFPEIQVTASNGSSLSFSGDYAAEVFSRTIRPMRYPPRWGSTDVQSNWDSYNTYTLNSLGYRSPEFFTGVDILAAGCSVTYGIGVPDNGTWPYLLAEMSDKTYVNLSAPGASVDWITSSIYRYINTYGAPKYLIVLFPDLLRGLTSVQLGFRESEKNTALDFIQQGWNIDGTSGIITRQFIEPESPKYLKKPYPIEDITGEAESIRIAIREIHNLELFCNLSGIKLIWSTWSDDLAVLVRDIPDALNVENFIGMNGLMGWLSNNKGIVASSNDPEGIADMKMEHRESDGLCTCIPGEMSEYCTVYSMCHYELADIYGLSFHMGTDRFREETSQAHIGVHKQIHIAETFYEGLVELDGLQ